MKRILVLLLSAALLCLLVGCECDHEWNAATCQIPKTCTKCGATEGGLASHRYNGATCTQPSTCQVCSATQGVAPGHVWKDATCETPETCKICHLTQGTPLGHDLVPVNLEGNIVTGECSRCHNRYNEQSPDPASVALKFLAGQWMATELYKGNAQVWEDVTAYNLSFIFTADGNATSVLPDNPGMGHVTFVNADNSSIQYEVDINGQSYDIHLYKHRNFPNEMYWIFRDYNSCFKCAK